MEKLKKFFDKTFLKFVLVGVVNTLFGTAIMFVFYNVFHLSYWLSSACRLYTSEETQRVYPMGNCAGSSLGFTNVDNEGMAGLELKYNKALTGRSGQVLTLVNPRILQMCIRDSTYTGKARCTCSTCRPDW